MKSGSSNYHTREGYERLYSQICRSEEALPAIKFMSNYELLSMINIELGKQGCIPFSFEEIQFIKQNIKGGQ